MGYKILLLLMFIDVGLCCGQNKSTKYSDSLRRAPLGDLLTARLIQVVNSDSIEESSVYSDCASLLYNKGLYHEAMKGYNKAIKRDGNEPMYWYNRGSLKKQLIDYRGAIDDFTEAIQLSPKDSEIFRSRAQCFMLLGKFKEAENDFTSAIKNGQESSDVYMNRGICKYELGDKEGGCKDFSKAGELGNVRAYEVIKQFCN